MAFKNRMPLPEAIRNAPVLNLGLQLYFEAYCELDSERSTGWGVGRIPWSSVQAYAQYNGYTSDQTDRLHNHVRAMDQAHREYLDKQSKKKNK